MMHAQNGFGLIWIPDSGFPKADRSFPCAGEFVKIFEKIFTQFRLGACTDLWSQTPTLRKSPVRLTKSSSSSKQIKPKPFCS